MTTSTPPKPKTQHPLRLARLNAGITAKAMAAKIGVSWAYLSQMELGRRPLLPKYAEKYAEALKEGRP